jgi:hypothetical protein
MIGDRTAYVNDIKVYIKDVVPQRNVLGHQVLSPEGRPKGVAGAEGTIISLEQLRVLRKALLDARQKFRSLHGALSAAP